MHSGTPAVTAHLQPCLHRWDVQGPGDENYSIKNLAYNSYISAPALSAQQQYALVPQSQAPYDWSLVKSASSASAF